MMPKLNVLVAGSTGYIGVQLIKLLVKHANIKIKYLCGNTSVGKNISHYEKLLSKNKLPKIVKFNKSFEISCASPLGKAVKTRSTFFKRDLLYLIILGSFFELNDFS